MLMNLINFRKDMRQNRFYIFHIAIIAILIFMVVGCGYKANPYYPKKTKEVSK